MSIKTIPLNRLEADLRATLDECVVTGDAVVVEMPDNRFVAIQALEPTADDTLIDDLIRSNPAFQAKIAKSKQSPRKPFTFGSRG